MADDFTTVHLKDGTTLHLKGQVSPEDIPARVQTFRSSQVGNQPGPNDPKISEYHPSEWEKFKQAVPSVGYVSDVLSGRRSINSSMHPEDVGQLVYPERALSQKAREDHPIATGFDEFMGSLTSPDNILLMKGMGAMGIFGKTLGRVLPRVASGIFAGQMGQGAYETGTQAKNMYRQYKDTGDEKYLQEAQRLGTHSILNGAFALLSGTHAAGLGEKISRPQEQAKIPDQPIAETGKTESEARAEKTALQTPSPQTGSAPVSVVKPPADIIGQRTAPPRTEAPLQHGFDTTPAPDLLSRARENLTSSPKSGIMPLEGGNAEVFSQMDLRRALDGMNQDAVKKPVPKLGTPINDYVNIPFENRKPAQEIVDLNNKAAELDRITRTNRVIDELEVQRKAARLEELKNEFAKKAGSPAVGGEAPTTEVAKPDSKSISTAASAEGSGEPVQPTERPSVNPFQTIEIDRKAQAQAKAEGLTGSDFLRRAQELKEQALAAPPKASFQGKAPSLDIFNERVKQILKKTPGMAEGTAKRLAAEQLRKESGLLSFKPIPAGQRPQFHPVQRLADALEGVARFFEGNRGLDVDEIGRKEQARNIIREAGAGLARSHLQVMDALDDAIKRHDNPTNERQNFIDFMDAGEKKPGARFLDPKDQALSDELHKMFEERWDRVKAVKGLESDGIENYLAHIWEKPGQVSKAIGGLISGKRPLAGSGRFLNQRFYQYASEGLDHGLTPVSWNPVRLQLQALFETDKFLMAHEIKDRFKDAGLVQWFKVGQYSDVPQGWQRLDDKIFAPKATGNGALQEFGTYYAPPEVASIFNRFLSPGLGANPLYRAVRGYGNRLNMVNLGISAYHGTMISLVSATSDLALGMQKMANLGDFKGGLKDAFRGTIGTFILRSAANDYKLGRAIQEEAINPSGNPRLQSFVDLMLQGGGRFKQDAFYTQGMSETKGVKNWLNLMNPRDPHPFRFLDAGVRAASGPIMDKFVPRVKLGAAARMMSAKLEHMVLKQGIVDDAAITQEMGKIWDSIDNRAGQMVYDNLFWNKMGKDLAFVGVRAVGWDVGSLREYGGGALVDAPRQASKMLRGQRPELTARLAFTMATPITIGMFGGMLHYMMTGKAPQKTEDYFYPGPDGNKVSFPNYIKDMYSFKNDPVQAVIGKLHPMWGQFGQLLQNSDAYGTEIWHPADKLLDNGLRFLKWYGGSYIPLSYRGIEKRLDRGEGVGSAGSSFFGFMPAPSYIGESKAEKLAFDLSKRDWKTGPRTEADSQRHALIQKFSRDVDNKALDQKEVLQAWKDKRIQDTDLDKIYDTARDSKLVRNFKDLKLPDALAVMREADKNERVQLKPSLLDKVDQLDRYPTDAQQQYMREIRSYIQ